MSQKIPITQGQMLTLIHDENELKRMLLEKMLSPRVNQWRRENGIVNQGIVNSHDRLVQKYFVIKDDKVQYTEADPKADPPIVAKPILNDGMTEEMFKAEEKEWMEKEKTMLV